MDNLYFKQLFRKFSGYIYQYTGEIPDGEDPKIFLIDEFVSIANRTGLEINLTQVSNGTFVVHSYENLESEVFIKLCDLSYEPEPEPEPEVQPEPAPASGEEE
jgi:hypothetical protein